MHCTKTNDNGSRPESRNYSHDGGFAESTTTESETNGYCGVMLAVLAFIGLAACELQAADWNQILGPNRNGQAHGEKLADQWPVGGPKKLWTHDVGQGYAGAAVVDDKVVIFHRIGDQERVEQLDAGSGKTIWKQDFEAFYRGGINPDLGPRCVPVIAAGRVVLFGAAGVAHAVDFKSGKPIWTRDLYGDYDGQNGYFGAGSTPIVVDDVALFNVGGAGAGFVALDVSTGQTIWKGTDEQASYSSPTTVQHKGRLHVLFLARLNAVMLDPKNGETIFSLPFGKRGPTVNAAAPLIENNRLFLTASYGIGAQTLELKSSPPNSLWSNDSSLSSQYNTPVIANGKLYGIHGREDSAPGEFRCVDLETGKVEWSKPRFGVAHTILADGKIIVLTIDGEAVLLRASPDKYTELARAKFADGETRALPALSNGRFFARDARLLYCLGLSP